MAYLSWALLRVRGLWGLRESIFDHRICVAYQTPLAKKERLPRALFLGLENEKNSPRQNRGLLGITFHLKYMCACFQLVS